MAIRGRKPKAAAEKLLLGNPGKRPLDTPAVPAPPDAPLVCPVSVQNNGRARTYWGLYLGMTAPGHLAGVDAPLLARLCMALAYADAATEEVEKSGLLVKNPHGGLPMQNPYLGVANRQTEIARKLAAELALPPAERSRVGGGGKGDGAKPDEWGF